MKDSMKSENLVQEGFKKLCDIKDLRNNEGTRFIIDNIDVAVFKVDSEVFALSNICPHKLSALIYDGMIEEGCVVCPVHGWMFNLKTGRRPDGTQGLDSYQVQLINDEVYVKVFSKKFNW